jgi:hypothetical protein
MAQGDFYINDILLPKSSIKPTKGRLDFEISERTIDNTFVSDLKAIKEKRSFTWENALDEDFITPMMEIYYAGEDVIYREVNSDLTETTFTMRMKIPDDIAQEVLEGSYAYSGFSISLEEV